jgi:hypothetical protein
VRESPEGGEVQWVVAETSEIGSNSPFRSISRTHSSWVAMSASISAIVDRSFRIVARSPKSGHVSEKPWGDFRTRSLALEVR